MKPAHVPGNGLRDARHDQVAAVCFQTQADMVAVWEVLWQGCCQSPDMAGANAAVAQGRQVEPALVALAEFAKPTACESYSTG
jgi:hypothetical protein